MNSRQKCSKLLVSSLLILSFILISTLGVGCSTGELHGQRGYWELSELPLDVNEPAPFAGVLCTFERFGYLLRCENYTQQSGVEP